MNIPNELLRCEALSKPSITQFSVSCLLMVWLVICYIPQWARIVSRKSAEGLSTLYILLGSLSGVCAVGNIMVLPSSEDEIGCCRYRSTFACVSGLLGMAQVIFGIACFWVVLFMYVYFAEEEADAEIHGRRNSIGGPERTFRRARRAIYVLLAATSFAMLIFLISATILHWFGRVAEVWANILGVAVTVFACIQWVPQIMTSWRLGHLGSLSLASLCLTAPYTWIFGINMLIRTGLRGWSSWIVYTIVGIMQIVLIIMGGMFKLRDREKEHAGTNEHRPSLLEHFKVPGWSRSSQSVASSNMPPDERRPLLAEHTVSNGSGGRAASGSRTRIVV